MRIEGLGEFESLQKAARKDTPRKAVPYGDAVPPKAEGSDAVAISPKARLLAKLSQMPEVRQAVVEHARKQIEEGKLDNPIALRESVERMLTELL